MLSLYSGHNSNTLRFGYLLPWTDALSTHLSGARKHVAAPPPPPLSIPLPTLGPTTLATQTDDLSLTPGTRMWEGENQLPQAVP